MATRDELMDRGVSLARKYDTEELKAALSIAVATGDNEERLSLQYALKQKTGESNGYQFAKEQQEKNSKRLVV